ncbi:unnamed protein product [Rotaria sp. Silwood1]|nr:unnamed protein product [Rotaria sp. Silwood1]
MKHEFDEKLHNVGNRYKNEIEDLTRCYEQITVKNDTLEKCLTESSSENFETFTTDGSRYVESLERELQDAQPELKTIDDSNKLIQSSSTRKSLSNRIHDDDDDEELSDTDNPSCKDKLNTNKVLREEPRFINSIPNGKRFVVGQGYDKINIIHLVAKWIAEYGLPDALDLNYDITRKYTPTWYDEELRGLAAELIKAACSVLGTWDESTISSTLLHLRSLNWDEKAPIDKYSTITIYHLNASYEDYANHFHDYYKQKYTTSHTFANFDYADLVGAIRAYIQFSNSLNIALAMLINTKRTCSVHLNLEEFHRNTSNNNIGFLGIEYRAKEFNVYL